MQIPRGEAINRNSCVRISILPGIRIHTLGIDEVEIGGPLERRFRLDLICPLVYQYTARILSLEPSMNGLKSVGRTIAAGPREKFHVEPRVDWTKDRALGARN